MPSKFIFAYRDFDGDRQQFSLDVAEGTAVANWTTMGAEFDKWVVGLGAGGGFFDEEAVDPGGSSSNPLAQLSIQGIIEYTDTVTGGVYTQRFPMPDLAKANDVGTNPAYIISGGLTVFNPSHADYATLVAAIEADAISPNGNAVTVNRIYIEE